MPDMTPAPATPAVSYYTTTAGQTVTVPAGQEESAEARGWMPASPQAKQLAQHQAEIAQKYAGLGQGAVAFTEGGLDALTLGLSTGGERFLDYLGVPGMTPQEIAGREEYHPLAHAAGTAVGVLAPLLVGDFAPAAEEGLVGGARSLLAKSAPAKISEIGKSAGDATRRFMGIAHEGEPVAKTLFEGTLNGEGLSPIARALRAKVVPGVVQGSVEGAFYGLGQEIHEDFLGDPRLHAESILGSGGFAKFIGNVGGGALTGGLLGGGGGFITGFGKELGDKVAPWLTKVQEGAYAKQMGIPLPRPSGPDPITFKEMIDLGLIDGAASPERVANAATTVKAKADALRDSIFDRASTGKADVSLPRMYDALKTHLVDPLFQAGDEASTSQALLAQATLDSWAQKLAGTDLKASNVIDIKTGLPHDFAKATTSVKTIYDTAYDAFHGIPGSEEAIDRVVRNNLKYDNLDKVWLTADRMSSAATLADKYADIAKAARVAKAGESKTPWEAVLGGFEALHSGSLGAGLGTTAVTWAAKKAAQKYGAGVVGAAAGGLRDTLTGFPATRLTNDLRGAMQFPAGASTNPLEEAAFAKSKGLTVEELERSPHAKDLWDEFYMKAHAGEYPETKHIMDNLAEGHGVASKALTNAKTGFRAEAIRGAVGAEQDEPEKVPGRKPTTPAVPKVPPELSEEMGEAVAEGKTRMLSQIGKATDDLFEKTKAEVQKAIQSGKPLVLGGAAVSAAIPVIMERMNAIRSLQNPDAMTAHLGDGIEGISDHAPKIAQATATAATNIVGLLQAAMPQSTPTGPLSEPIPPSKAALIDWNSKYEAAVDPVGQALHQPDVVAQMYPQLMDQIRQEIVNSVMSREHPDKIPYSTKVALSPVMGQDLTGDLSLALANSIGMAAQAPQGSSGRIRATQKGLGKLNVASRMGTQTRDAMAGSQK